MKKFALSFVALAAIGGMISCSGDNQAKNTPSDAEAASASASNIRFYSLDSIQSGYEFVKKLNEEADAALAAYQTEERARANEIQRLGTQIEDKMRNNLYTEETYQADMVNFQNKQTQAQNYLAGLQQQLAQKAQEQQNALLDSINNFLRDYNATRGYDAIFIITPGGYVNPALDITEEIITGLNQRYQGATAPAAPSQAAQADAPASK